MKESMRKAVIVGAGPAGLTAGYELTQAHGWAVSIIEKDEQVGGLSKTFVFKGCRFDIGPHHFITEHEPILRWWQHLMGDDFAALQRFTRIYYKRRFFHYPLSPLNAITNLTLIECVQCVASYVKAKILPKRSIVSLQDFMINRFGKRLFQMFFKNYTEKLWGMSCDAISADWAAQRIRNFSLCKAIFFAFFGRWFKKYAPRTIQDTFYYPSRGAGTLWQRVAGIIEQSSENTIELGQNVIGIEHNGSCITAVLTSSSTVPAGSSCVVRRHEGDYFFSTMTLSSLVQALDPVAPAHVRAAACALRCRSLIVVNLIVNKPFISPDHWLYIHETRVQHIRVGNMNNFSSKMVDDQTHTALSFEYFMSTEDDLWHWSDQELIALCSREIELLGLAHQTEVLDGMVVRAADAYPIYDAHYQEHVQCVRSYLAQFNNLRLIGRNGTHSYNNMDAAMLSAMDAVACVQEHAMSTHASKRECTSSSSGARL